jgi:hypothetical protein
VTETGIKGNFDELAYCLDVHHNRKAFYYYLAKRTFHLLPVCNLCESSQYIKTALRRNSKMLRLKTAERDLNDTAEHDPVPGRHADHLVWIQRIRVR